MKFAIGSLLGGLTLFGGFNFIHIENGSLHFHFGERVASPTPSPTPLSVPTPDQPLWARLGLVVRNEPGGGLIIESVSGAAADSNVPAGSEIRTIRVGHPRMTQASNSADLVFAKRSITSSKDGEEAVREGIAGGNQRQLNDLRIELETWKEGKMMTKDFTIPLETSLPAN